MLVLLKITKFEIDIQSEFSSFLIKNVCVVIALALSLLIQIVVSLFIFSHLLLCVFQRGMKGKMCRRKYEGTRTHWLYYADDKFDVSPAKSSLLFFL